MKLSLRLGATLLLLLVSVVLVLSVSAQSAKFLPVLSYKTVSANGPVITASLAYVNMEPGTWVRITRQADEPNYLTGQRTTTLTTAAAQVMWEGYFSYSDSTLMENSEYTYTLTTAEGVVVQIQLDTYELLLVPQPVPPVTSNCFNSLPTKFALGMQGIALQYQAGYTRASVDALDSNGTPIDLWKDTVFYIVNGPVCDSQGLRWWQVVTERQYAQHDQVFYVLESLNNAYLLHPLGTQVVVPTARLLNGDRQYWTPVVSRFKINIREVPSWCKVGSEFRSKVVLQAEFGDVFSVLAITSDTRWVLLELPGGGRGWASTHLGTTNFVVPDLAYNNTLGIFVYPPATYDPIPAYGRCDW